MSIDDVSANFSRRAVADPAAFDLPARAQQPPPQQQDEFIPIQAAASGPASRGPAAGGAYSFVALALFAYVVSVARRLGSVQQELNRLESELKRSGRT